MAKVDQLIKSTKGLIIRNSSASKSIDALNFFTMALCNFTILNADQVLLLFRARSGSKLIQRLSCHMQSKELNLNASCAMPKLFLSIIENILSLRIKIIKQFADSTMIITINAEQKQTFSSSVRRKNPS